MPNTPLQRPLLSVPCPDILTIEQAQAGGGLVAIMAVWNDAEQACTLAAENRASSAHLRAFADQYDAAAATLETFPTRPRDTDTHGTRETRTHPDRDRVHPTRQTPAHGTRERHTRYGSVRHDTRRARDVSTSR